MDNLSYSQKVNLKSCHEYVYGAYFCYKINSLSLKNLHCFLSVLVDASDQCNTMTFQLGVAGQGTALAATRSWNIKVKLSYCFWFTAPFETKKFAANHKLSVTVPICKPILKFVSIKNQSILPGMTIMLSRIYKILNRLPLI